MASETGLPLRFDGERVHLFVRDGLNKWQGGIFPDSVGLMTPGDFDFPGFEPSKSPYNELMHWKYKDNG